MDPQDPETYSPDIEVLMGEAVHHELKGIAADTEVAPKTIIFIIVVTLVVVLLLLLLLFWMFGNSSDEKEKAKVEERENAFYGRHHLSQINANIQQFGHQAQAFGNQAFNFASNEQDSAALGTGHPSSPSNVWSKNKLRQRGGSHFNFGDTSGGGGGAGQGGGTGGLPRPHPSGGAAGAGTGGGGGGGSSSTKHFGSPDLQSFGGSGGSAESSPSGHFRTSTVHGDDPNHLNNGGNTGYWDDVATTAVTTQAANAAAAATQAAAVMFQYAAQVSAASKMLPKGMTKQKTSPVQSDGETDGIYGAPNRVKPTPSPTNCTSASPRSGSGSEHESSGGGGGSGVKNRMGRGGGGGGGGFGGGGGGLRGSGPLINVLRNNAVAEGGHTNNSSTPTESSGHSWAQPDGDSGGESSSGATSSDGTGYGALRHARPPRSNAGVRESPGSTANKTEPLSFLPLQEDMQRKVGLSSADSGGAAAGSTAGGGGSGDGRNTVDELMLSMLPSLQLKELSLEYVLGGGAFGQVWRGTWRGTPVAVKVLSGALQKFNMPAAELKAFVDEVQMLARLRHPNICLFMGVCIDPPNRAIVTELVSRGSLWDVLRTPDVFPGSGNGCSTLNSDHDGSQPSPRGQPWWPMWAVRRVLDGTTKGLAYLHSNTPQPIIHRDLKSANILLDDSFNVKICDFGLARLRDFSTQMTANVGTVQWMAPEVLMGKEYTETADIYSLGMIAWELLTGKCPFEGLGQMEIAIQVTQKNARPTVPAFCDSKQLKFIQRCWAPVPSDRYSAAEALQAIVEAFPNKT